MLSNSGESHDSGDLDNSQESGDFGEYGDSEKSGMSGKSGNSGDYMISFKFCKFLENYQFWQMV